MACFRNCRLFFGLKSKLGLGEYTRGEARKAKLTQRMLALYHLLPEPSIVFGSIFALAKIAIKNYNILHEPNASYGCSGNCLWGASDNLPQFSRDFDRHLFYYSRR